MKAGCGLPFLLRARKPNDKRKNPPDRSRGGSFFQQNGCQRSRGRADRVGYI